MPIRNMAETMMIKANTLSTPADTFEASENIAFNLFSGQRKK
jgi:hypothetical protein